MHSGILILGASMLLGAGCKSGEISNAPADARVGTLDSGDSTLCVTVFPSSLFSGDSATIEACSGVPPYVYSVRSGEATIDPYGKLVSGPTTETIVVDVHDVNGALGSVRLENINPQTFESASLWVRGDELPVLAAAEEVGEWPAIRGEPLRQDNGGLMPKYNPGSIGGRPALSFDGTDDRLEWPYQTVPVMGAGSRTVVAVIANGVPHTTHSNVVVGWGGAQTYGNTYGLAFKLQESIARGGSNYGSEYHCLSSSLPCLSGSVNPGQAPTLIVLSYDGTTDQVWINGHLDAQEDIRLNTTQVHALGVGGIHIGVGVYHGYQGDIGEVIVFDHVIEAPQLQRLQCALGQKFGIIVKDCESKAVEISPATAQRTQTSSQLQLNANGGRLPYQYSLIEGGGSIDGDTGLYTAPTSVGTAVVQVQDASGTVSKVSIEVTTIPRTEMWFAADAIKGVSNASPLGQWKDLSGNERHLRRPDTAKQPIYLDDGGLGFPAIRFDGVNDSIVNGILPVKLDRPRTLAVVVSNIVSDGSSQGILGYGGLLACRRFFGLRVTPNSQVIAGSYGCSIFPTEEVASVERQIIIQVHSPAGEEIYVNGVRSTRPVIALDTIHHKGMILGSSVNTVDVGFFKGDISEFLFFDHALSETDRIALQDMLLSKYPL